MTNKEKTTIISEAFNGVKTEIDNFLKYLSNEGIKTLSDVENKEALEKHIEDYKNAFGTPEVEVNETTDMFDDDLNGFVDYSEKEGEVFILNEKHPKFQGVFVGMGRNIGEGSDETATLKFVNLKNKRIYLIPYKSALSSIVEVENLEAKKMLKPCKYEILITYKGKRESKNGKTYHDYSIQYRENKTELKEGSDYNINHNLETI